MKTHDEFDREMDKHQGPFVEAEDDFIRANVDKMTRKQLAESLGRPISSIWSRCILLGVIVPKHKDPRRLFTSEEDDAIRCMWSEFWDRPGVIARAIGRHREGDGHAVKRRATQYLGLAEPSKPAAEVVTWESPVIQQKPLIVQSVAYSSPHSRLARPTWFENEKNNIADKMVARR